MENRYVRNRAGLPIRLRENATCEQLEKLGIQPQTAETIIEEADTNTPNMRRARTLREMMRRVSLRQQKPKLHDDGWY